MDRANLVATKEDLLKFKNVLSNTDLIETCNVPNGKSKYKVENLQIDKCHVFAAPLKDDPMGSKDAVLPEPLTKNHTVYFPTYDEDTREPYKDNLCLMEQEHTHGKGGLEEEISKMFNPFVEKTSGSDPTNFRCVFMMFILAMGVSFCTT